MSECRWCGETVTGPHPLPPVKCPHVKAFEFDEDGTTVRRVEFLTPMDRMPMNGWPMAVAAPAYPYTTPPQFYPQPQVFPVPQQRYPSSLCGQAADPQSKSQNAAARATRGGTNA